MATVYKICTADEWQQAEAEGVFRGSPVDKRDGFIHFSTGEQVKETAARHFGGRDGLMIVAFDEKALGPRLRYEPSRGGQLFPHLYGRLDPKVALWATRLPLGADGAHVFPDLTP